MTRTRAVRLAVIVGGCAALALMVACRPVEDHKPAYASVKAGDVMKAKVTLIAVAPPPFSPDMFPCSACHGLTDKVVRTPHKVDFHDTIVLKHDEKNRWCLDCHSAQHRDSLHLADGRLVAFTESYRLCGQCHGPTLRNWKAGEHGKRTGSWSSTKQYLLCPSCHNPHQPHFKPLKGREAPLRQEAIK